MITVALDIEGYDVEVDILEGAIRREIERTERDHPEAINQDGSRAFDCSKMVSVDVEPTAEKWGELLQFGLGDQQ